MAKLNNSGHMMHHDQPEKLAEVFIGPFFGGGIETWFAYAVALVFLLIHVIPGDPIDAILGDQAAPEDRAVHAARAEVFERRRAAETSTMARGVFGGAARESREAAGEAPERR